MVVALIALSLHWQISGCMLIYILLTTLYFLLIPDTLQPKASEFEDEVDEDEENFTVNKISLEKARDQQERETELSDRSIFFRKKYISQFMFGFSVVFLVILYLDSFLQVLRREHYKDPERAKDALDPLQFYNQLIMWAFFGGVGFQEDKRHYSFLYQSLGYTIMILLCVLERKSEIWISSRFGCEGNTLDYLNQRDEVEKDEASAFNSEKTRVELINSIRESETSMKEDPDK